MVTCLPIRHLVLWAWLIAVCGGQANDAFAVTNPDSTERLQADTINSVKNRLNPILNRYCFDSCEIVHVDVAVDEEIADTDDIGFEGASNRNAAVSFKVSRVAVEVQIDDRVTEANRDRLLRILQNHTRDFGLKTEIMWRPVTLPNIGKGADGERQLRDNLERRLSKVVEDILRVYCPEQCLIAQINAEGRNIPFDEAQRLPSTQISTDDSARSAFKIDDVTIEISMDEQLDEAVRQKIVNVIRAKTRFVSPVSVNVSTTAFPEPYAKLREKEKASAEDPYGLEKLRQMLVMFRELAGTKEIITNNSSTNSSTNSSLSNSTEKAENTESSSRLDRSLSTSAMQEYGQTGTQEWLMYGLIGLVVAGLVIALLMRVMGANRDAKAMMMPASFAAPSQGASPTAPQPGAADGQGAAASAEGGGATVTNIEQKRVGKLRMQCDQLRSELIQLFMDSPKVARETFGRLLKEDGVEETAKYVHILGHMVIFELLEDPQVQRDLYQLSEYYHNTRYEFTVEDEFRLLQALKTRATASEIRILSRKSLDKFDFLGKLDAEQIYSLIVDEKPQVQSIVLTQLDKKRRMTVFNMYQGESKLKLMGELCRADAIPKDYLANVASALAKKVQARPEFDTENLRSSDILLDLMERADLEEQRGLMANLQKTNADAARGLRMKLVTIEMLPYLKDGHLLELIMGMEREDLLAFLMGTREHIRNLLLGKAPGELAESWVEDLQNMASVDETAYRLVEMKILGRVRSLASNGAISILDINELIFSGSTGAQRGQLPPESIPGRMSPASMVA